ncbi:MAG: hypothetical protein J7480_03225 [Microbacteriaceae bacterium]|nr:hypothetical protein [Microbacteriaceae bacterium]
MNTFDDDELRLRLRRVDPARDLPAFDQERTARMSQQTIENAQPETPDPAPRRRGLWWGIGGALAGVAAASVVTAVVLTSGVGGPAAPGAKRPPLQLADQGQNVAAMCMALTPELLDGNQGAFRGTVVAIEGDRVTVQVDLVYRGEPGPTVELTQQDAQAADFSATQYVLGGSFLISYSDGYVAYCGQSAAASPELTAVYEAAYGPGTPVGGQGVAVGEPAPGQPGTEQPSPKLPAELDGPVTIGEPQDLIVDAALDLPIDGYPSEATHVRVTITGHGAGSMSFDSDAPGFAVTGTWTADDAAAGLAVTTADIPLAEATLLRFRPSEGFSATVVLQYVAVPQA